MDSPRVKELLAKLVDAIQEETRNQLLAALGGPAKAARQAPAAPVAKKAVKRDMSCIAPGCKSRSKGPRFRFLCEKHLKASSKDVESWRAARSG